MHRRRLWSINEERAPLLSVTVPRDADIREPIVDALKGEGLYSPDLLYRNPGGVYDLEEHPETIDELLAEGTDRTDSGDVVDDYGFRFGVSRDIRDYVWAGREEDLGVSVKAGDGSLLIVYDPTHLQEIGDMEYEFLHPDQKDEAVVALLAITEE